MKRSSGLSISIGLSHDSSLIATTAWRRNDAGTVCLAAWIPRPAPDFTGVSQGLTVADFGGAARADEFRRTARLRDLSEGGKVD